MDSPQKTIRTAAPQRSAVHIDAEKLVSLPAWQSARRRLEQYLALLGTPEPMRQHWISLAFTRALRHRANSDSPVRLAMTELQLLLAEHNAGPLHSAIRRSNGITRTPLPSASLAATPGRTWLRWVGRLSRRLRGACLD